MIKVELKRLFKQKFIWLFLLAFTLAAWSYSYLLSTAELYAQLNIDPLAASGAKFPEFMLPFYNIIVGPLFMSFITAIYINEDNLAGMLKQPLLHGRTKTDVINSKFAALGGLSIFMAAAVYVIANFVGFLKWGDEIFIMPQFGVTLQKFILVTVSLLTVETLTILLSLYTPNTVVLMGAMVTILLTDSLICNNLTGFAQIFMFNYSTHYYLSINEGDAALFFKIKGIIYDLLFLGLFYYLARRKINRMELR